ncbi:hypothetical protein ACHAPA_010481 [Fusarium lateritium]
MSLDPIIPPDVQALRDEAASVATNFINDRQVFQSVAESEFAMTRTERQHLEALRTAEAHRELAAQEQRHAEQRRLAAEGQARRDRFAEEEAAVSLLANQRREMIEESIALLSLQRERLAQPTEIPRFDTPPLPVVSAPPPHLGSPRSRYSTPRSLQTPSASRTSAPPRGLGDSMYATPQEDMTMKAHPRRINKLLVTSPNTVNIPETTDSDSDSHHAGPRYATPTPTTPSRFTRSRGRETLKDTIRDVPGPRLQTRSASFWGQTRHSCQSQRQATFTFVRVRPRMLFLEPDGYLDFSFLDSDIINVGHIGLVKSREDPGFH